MKYNKILILGNNLTLRNWYFSNLINQLNHNSDLCVYTHKKNIYNFLITKKIPVKYIKIPSLFLKFVNFSITANSMNNSSTVIIKKKKNDPLISILSKSISNFIILLFHIFKTKTKTKELIFTSLFDGGELFIDSIVNADKKVGFINSWDNPSSRHFFNIKYSEIYVWSPYVRDTLKKFYPNFNNVKIIGRIQDVIIPQLMDKESFYKKININSKRVLISYIHGGGYFDYMDNLKSLYNYCKKNNYFLLFRGYSEGDYSDITNSNFDSKYFKFSVPNALNIGVINDLEICDDNSDFIFYNSLLKYSKTIFTNGSTVLLDVLNYNKKGRVLLNTSTNDDYLYYLYFHLFVLNKMGGFNFVVNENFNDETNNENIQFLKQYFLGPTFNVKNFYI